MKLRPFQYWRKVVHHSKSALNSELRCTQWLILRADDAVSIILRRNNLPATTTLHAWDSFPINERSSLFLHLCLFLQSCNSCLSWLIFSCGSLNSIRLVSISMPRKVMIPEGPSIFCTFNGIPSHLHRCIISSKLWRHSFELGGPIVKKSSK